ncbi:hypothetical protein PybrP1_011373 [[Pythium] brassicae (nom. inval.)]|nr:hypothetical protein PybrP1_011373 [[Pythium] brassicae (nom. inval.)]
MSTRQIPVLQPALSTLSDIDEHDEYGGAASDRLGSIHYSPSRRHPSSHTIVLEDDSRGELDSFYSMRTPLMQQSSTASSSTDDNQFRSFPPHDNELLAQPDDKHSGRTTSPTAAQCYRHVVAAVAATLGRPMPQMEVRVQNFSLTAEITTHASAGAHPPLPSIANELAGIVADGGDITLASRAATDAESHAAETASHIVKTESRAAETDSARPEPMETEDAPGSSGHHATNLLHEAVERQQKLREGQAVRAARGASSDGVQTEADAQYGDVRTKNIPDLYYLFTNDKLKEEPLTQVLNSDPFCIPRLTDNVLEYRPAFNPLSILEGEEKLLPRYFRLDPFEGIPGAADKDGVAATAAVRAIRVRTGSASSAGAFGGGKSSTFMGTMPRQSEFSEAPVAETLFKTQQPFRPPPPPPVATVAAVATTVAAAPLPSYASKNLSILRSVKSWSEPPPPLPGAGAASSASTTAAAEPVTPTALTDAMFLTSLHQSGALPPPPPSERHASDYFASKQAAMLQPYDQAPYPPQGGGSGGDPAETLTRYLPSRPSPSGSVDSHTASTSSSSSSSMFLDEILFAAAQHREPYQRQLPPSSYQQALAGGGSDLQYLGGSSLSDYQDGGGDNDDDDDDDRSLLGATYDSGPSPPAGDTQSLQPIPKKPRSKNMFRPCTAPGCTKGARGKSGLCQKHGGGKRCSVAGCAKGAQGSSTMCLFHGGGYRCTVDGCSTGARGTSGLCAKHGGYKRGAKEAGAVEGPAGSGASPASSVCSGGGGTGKRARTQHPSPPPPRGFESAGDAGDFESALFS